MPKLSGFDPVPIPGPAPSRVFGHFPTLLRFLDDPYPVLERLRAHGDVVAITRNNPALVFVFGIERNREVLSNPRSFEHNEELIRGRAGTPLARISKIIININGDMHKRHRKLMMPAFTKAALDGYAEDIVRVATEQVGRWPVGEDTDLDVLVRHLALGVAIRTLFGLELTGDYGEIGELAERFGEAVAEPLSVLLPYDLPGLPYRRAQQLGGRVLAVLDELVARKRHGGEAGTDVLSRLIHAADDDDDGFDDDELTSEVTTLFFAGHETMAKTLSWTLFLLDRHPAVFDDLLDELDDVLGGRQVGVADIPRMPLLDGVIKESMRLLSPLPILFLRVLAQDAAIGSVQLPRHANVVVSPHATHHDPAIYPRPRRFEPERWIGLKPPAYAYLPFGAGPRSCIGGTFAHQALRLILPTVLQRARPALARGAKISRITRSNILRPRHGLPARLHPAGTRGLRAEPVGGDIHELLALD